MVTGGVVQQCMCIPMLMLVVGAIAINIGSYTKQDYIGYKN